MIPGHKSALLEADVKCLIGYKLGPVQLVSALYHAALKLKDLVHNAVTVVV